MSRRYPNGQRKRYQSFLLRLDTELITLLDLSENHTRHHTELSFLVNALLKNHVEKECIENE